MLLTLYSGTSVKKWRYAEKMLVKNFEMPITGAGIQNFSAGADVFPLAPIFLRWGRYFSPGADISPLAPIFLRLRRYFYARTDISPLAPKNFLPGADTISWDIISSRTDVHPTDNVVVPMANSNNKKRDNRFKNRLSRINCSDNRP